MQPFSFKALDGLGFASARGRLPALLPRSYVPEDLGPLLELARLAASGLLPAPSQAAWLDLGPYADFAKAFRERRPSWSSQHTGTGFLRLRREVPDDDSESIAFHLDAQRAAEAAGIPKKIAQQLVGAFQELQSNVYEHSGKPETGLAAYKAAGAQFEFAVSDGGVGVLATLAGCAEYAGLADHAEALRLMLTDGVSRYGRDARRGRGFRPLFLGLVNLAGELRFRSGDQMLSFDGTNPSVLAMKAAEKPQIEGFFVSVCCRVGTSRRQAASKPTQLPEGT